MRDTAQFQKTFDLPKVSYFDVLNTISREAIVSGYPSQVLTKNDEKDIWEETTNAGEMWADSGKFTPLGDNKSATALIEYEQSEIMTSKGQSGSGFLVFDNSSSG